MGRRGLVKRLFSEIEGQGQVSFARFMEMVLYDPEGGYYSSARKPTGIRGDYITSPEVHPVYGRLLTRQIREMLMPLTGKGPVTLLEAGAGSGDLMITILDQIKLEEPTLFKRLKVILVDRSKAMIQRQKEKLKKRGYARMTTWYSKMDSVIQKGGMSGLIFSNELIDALPVHRVVMSSTGLKEIFVTTERSRVVEIVDKPGTPELAEYFERLGLPLAVGQTAEVNLNGLRWIQEAGKALKKGYVMTSDYGHTARELFSPRRKKGTLLCYFRQTVSEDPYTRLGQQDITSHVDFTSLAEAGRESGLEATGFTDQQHFLLGLGLAQEMEGRDPQSPEFGWMKRLMSEEGMGRTFKVLIQHKGVIPQALSGLSWSAFFRDSLDRAP